MIFGLRKLGKTDVLNGQYIKTVFFIIGIPLIPVHSVFYISELNMIDIGLNFKSMFKTYLSWFTLLFSIIFLIGASFGNVFPLSPILSLTIGGIMLLSSAYFFFYFGNKVSEKEIEMRELFQKAIECNALPEYFSIKEAENFQKELLLTLKDKFQIKDWKEVIRNNEYNEQQLPLLFAISGFQNRIINSKSSLDLYNKVMQEYKALSNT